MPQKTIFTKYPLLSVPHSFLSCGLIRTEDQRIQKLYQKTRDHLGSPCIWEGAFRLAALLTDDPMTEPVTDRILSALAESEDGSFPGQVEEQIAIARAAMAVFEYNTDRSILKRIASWCRYLEIEWDQILATGKTVFSPADLMELLVRFYQAGGIKSVLRLCTKLRSTAFDWTTALHTIQQVIPPETEDEEQISFTEQLSAAELDYDQKQMLMSHAEMLADGIRYSLYAGIFSGNKQDLAAGKTAWNYLQKHYRAICGGTTASPFLSGSASNVRISTAAIAAWTEAFASQMILSGSEWAADEMVRIVFNGLSYCLNEDTLPAFQYVNCISQNNGNEEDSRLCAKVSRAVACACSHGLTVTETGIRINYLPTARYILMIQKQPVILSSEGDKIQFSCRGELAIPVDVFRPATETAAIALMSNGEKTVLISDPEESRSGRYLCVKRSWHSKDFISFEQGDRTITMSTHHQGLCWFVRNRLMVFECGKDHYQVAAAETPVIKDEKTEAKLYLIDGWHLHNDEPGDIPVLPGHYETTETALLVPYDRARSRISMFPRINPLCLK